MRLYLEKPAVHMTGLVFALSHFVPYWVIQQNVVYEVVDVGNFTIFEVWLPDED